MAVAFGSAGAVDDGTTAVDAAYPASISADDLLLYFIESKFSDSSHSQPSGFGPLDTETAGIGSNISDSGSVVASVFQKIATGSETGTESITVTNGNSSQGVIARVTRSGGTGFNIAATTARWETDATNPLSVTFDDAIGLETGDLVLVFVGWNTNASSGVTSPTLTAAGATFSAVTERAFATTGLGADSALYLCSATVDSGSSSATPSFEMTKSGSTQGEGPVILVRVREASAADPSSLPEVPHGYYRRMAPYFRF